MACMFVGSASPLHRESIRWLNQALDPIRCLLNAVAKRKKASDAITIRGGTRPIAAITESTRESVRRRITVVPTRKTMRLIGVFALAIEQQGLTSSSVG